MVRLLLGKIDGVPVESTEVVLSTRLVIRGST
jgi:DNA-binding LacI/PurR family transcriptional regulator